VDRLWQARFGVKFGLCAALGVSGGTLIPGCNAVSGLNDYTFDRACAQRIVATAEDCSTTEIDENCDGVASCSADGLWSRGFGARLAQEGRAVAFDRARNILVAGVFDGDINLAEGADLLTTEQGRDSFLAKFDPSGKPLWHKQFGGAGVQEVRSLAVDSQNNVFVVGSFTNVIAFDETILTNTGPAADIFVAKIGAGGNVLWSKQFGDDGEQIASAVAVDTANNVLFTGGFTGTLDFGVGATQLSSVEAHDVFVAKLDPNGNHLFSDRFGDVTANKGDQFGSAIAVGAGGAFFVGGRFQATLVNMQDLMITSSGLNDAFVIAFAADGSRQWAKGIGATPGAKTNQAITSLATDPDGNLIIAGWFDGEVIFPEKPPFPTKGAGDMFLAKFDPSGTLLWAAAHGTTGEDVPTAVATDGARNVLLTGSVFEAVDFGAGLKTGGTPPTNDFFLAKFDGAGLAKATPRFAEAGFQRGYGVASDALGNIAVTGAFGGTVTLEQGVGLVSVSPPSTPQSYEDAFLAVFRP
jgi:hypothetical protein